MDLKLFDYEFMERAIKMSTYSTCRRQVGAVIVKDNKIVSFGYNNAPNGLKTCQDLGGCMRQKNQIVSGTRQEFCRAVHAEQNAIILAACEGISISGGTLYVTTYPCSICTRMIINCKLERIVYKGDYQDELSHELLKESGILVENYEKLMEQKLLFKK